MDERRNLLNPKEIVSFSQGQCILISPSYSDSLQDNAEQNTVRVKIGTKNYLGDPSCAYNARSKYLLCAVNPSGSCSDCPHYQRREDFPQQLLSVYSSEAVRALISNCSTKIIFNPQEVASAEELVDRLQRNSEKNFVSKCNNCSIGE